MQLDTTGHLAVRHASMVSGLDMHDGGTPIVPEAERLTAGATVVGFVVCHHHFGLGVKVEGRDEYGHVDIAAVAPPERRLRGPEDFPPVGARVEARVLGYSGDQLQLALAHPSGDRDIHTVPHP